MKRLRAVLGLLLVVGAVYVGYKLFPPYFAHYQFQDAIQVEAQEATYAAYRKNDNELRDSIMWKARDLEIPITADQIKITRVGQSVAITADYTVHVDMPVHPTDLEFHISTKGK